MYINLIIGAIALGALWLLVRGLRQKFRSPSAILQEELEERRKRSLRVQETLQRVRSRAAERLAPVKKAVHEMNASLLEAQRFSVREEEDSLSLQQERITLTVTYQLASFSLDGSTQELEENMAHYERFLLEVHDGIADTTRTREAVTQEEAIRLVAREIAVLVQE